MRSSNRLTRVLVVALLSFTFTSGLAAAHPRLDIRADKTLDIPTTLTVLIASPDRGFHGTFARTKHRTKLPPDYTEWTKVAVCEEGGWYAPGGFYPDALGVNATNYHAFGGKPDHGRLTVAQRIAEIRVADRLIKRYHAQIPDQGGCAAW